MGAFCRQPLPSAAHAVHRLHADPSTWEAGPSLLLTPDSVLLYPSGSVLFCRGALGKLTDGEGEGVQRGKRGP